MCKCWVLLLIVSILNFKACFGVLATNQEPPKPAYTSGIKTVGWRNPNNAYTYHNYSKVAVHNKPTADVQYYVTQTERTVKVYPVYNAHSYGSLSHNRGNVLQQTSNVVQPGSNAETNQRNRTIYKRKIEYKVLEVYDKCPEDATGQFVYALSCNQFLNCWKGRGQPENCAPGTLFNPKTLECDFPNKVECITGARQNIVDLRERKAVSQASCPDNFSGLIPNYTDCSKFINCNHGQSVKTDCPPGTLFDTNQNVCDFPYKATCFNGETGKNYQLGTQNQNVQGQYSSSHPIMDSKLDFGSNRRDCSGGRYNCHDQTGSGSNSYSTIQRGCNPAFQNCDKLGSQTNYDQWTGYSQTGKVNYNVQSNCNPAVQNCHQIGSTGIYEQQSGCNPATHNCAQTGNKINYGQPSGCNPAIQNCAQTGTIVSYGEVSDCNPATQNCAHTGANTGYGHSTAYNYNDIRTTGIKGTHASGTFSTTACNPTYQNCGESGFNSGHTQTQTTTNIHQIGQNRGPRIQGTDQSGYSEQVSGRTYHTIQRCNPVDQNCGQSAIRSEGSQIQNQNQQFAGQGGVTNYNQHAGQITTNTQNYNKICNIGDTSCHTTLSGTNAQHGQSSGYGHNTGYGQSGGQGQNTGNSQSGGYHQSGGYDQSGGYGQPLSASNVPSTQQGGEPKCPNGFQGITKHPTDCKKFLNCANGLTFIQDCAPGTLFNPKIGNCDFPYNVDCQSTPSPTNVGGAEEKHIQNIGHNVNTVVEEVETTTTNQYYNRGRNQGQTNRPASNYYQSTTRKYTTPNIDDVTEGPNPIQTNNNPDYVDVFDPNEKSFGYRSTSPKSTNSWPPPFPTNTEYDDYEFEYDDGEPVTIKPGDVFRATRKENRFCEQGDFHCNVNQCISKTMVCDGVRDCDNGKDEYGCDEFVGRFSVRKRSRLEVLEKQKWLNVSYTTCALLCTQNTQFNCRAFNYRRTDRTCFLSDLNIGFTGALRSNYLFDYYELKAGTVVCTDSSKYFECSNEKCIKKSQICDGFDDCGDRDDEKNCKKEDFGYSLRLTGSKEKNEGTVEVTAFGKTGYICDDQFGILDANVICRELGFELGAAEVKGQSFFNKNLTQKSFYMMDEIDCYGNETSLLDCDFAGWGVHDCGEMEAAGLVCKTPQEQCGYGYWRCDTGNECIPNSFICDGVFDCSDNSDENSKYCEAPTEIRLVNGSSYHLGRLEIRHHGVWGTVCDDDFNEDAAKVICKHLGFRGRSEVKKEGYFGSGEGPIWLDQVSCYGNETSLEQCTHWNWGEHNCDHSEDVGVVCTNDMSGVDVQRHSKYPGGTSEKSTGTGTGLKIDKCGFRKDNQFLENDLIHARVVSGTVAQKGDYPWQAAIRVKVKEKSAHWCGAIILSSKWVITAAHCLQGYAKGAYIIVAGEYNTDEEEGTEQQKYIEDFFIHDNFRKGHKMNNDIALIKLKGEGFALNPDIQPICLPDGDADYRGLNCTISGFGSVKSGTSGYSHNMMAAWIPIHSNEVCKMPHIYGSSLTDGMICAGFLDGGVDACDGDSGGPLACLDRGVFTLYGITSWGQHCGYANKPGVYVKVAHYRNWIDNIINKHS